MKKIITKTNLFLTAILLSGNINAQNILIDDFEGGDKGWISVSCEDYDHDIRENEYKEGVNTSDHVLFIKRSPEYDNWSGAMLPDGNLAGSPITGYRYLHVKMYRNNTDIPNLKVNGVDLEPMEMKTIANQWQDVVFDIGTPVVNSVIFMVDRLPLSEDAWMLVDDIILSNERDISEAPAKPGTAVYDPSKVLSVYCSAYTNIAGIKYNPWGESTLVNPNFEVEDTNVLQYKNLNFQGTEFPDQNLADMDYLHVDVWSATAFTPKISLINRDPEIEKSYPLPLEGKQWNSFDIPLTVFDMPQNAIWQLKFDNGGGNTIYIANWYFFLKGTPTDVNTKCTDKPAVFFANGKLCISGSDESVTVYNSLGKIIYVNASAKNVSVELAKGLYIVKVGATVTKVLVK